MKLEELRTKGSQALDDFAEFIITDRSVLVYEQCGNGIYHLERVYKILRSDKFGVSFIDMEIRDAERLSGGVIA
jgi:hypothetical protein